MFAIGLIVSSKYESKFPRSNEKDPRTFQDQHNRASMFLSLQVPVAQCLGGIREAQLTIPLSLTDLPITTRIHDSGVETLVVFKCLKFRKNIAFYECEMFSVSVYLIYLSYLPIHTSVGLSIDSNSVSRQYRSAIEPKVDGRYVFVHVCFLPYFRLMIRREADGRHVFLCNFSMHLDFYILDQR